MRKYETAWSTTEVWVVAALGFLLGLWVQWRIVSE